MRYYRIGQQDFAESASELPDALQKAYEHRLRPLCLCRNPAPAMYIARLDEDYVIKRMPLTGRDHDPSCGSYEPPYDLSGLGPLIGNAVQLDEASGNAVVKLDFSLSKRAGFATPTAASSASDSVKNEARKLSLRALLHYLWEAGELTEWTALWRGKRGWGKVSSSLVSAAGQVLVRGNQLSDILFVPEVFHSDKKSEIAARRATRLSALEARDSGARKLMVLIGEVKRFPEARFGRRLVVKQMPDFPLFMEEAAWKRLQMRFEVEFDLWYSDDSNHLIAIATFGISRSGIATVNEIALMVVTENWIPFENVAEKALLDRLAGFRQKSVKALRFNLPRSAPIVCVTLPEHKPVPAALYVVPASADEDYEQSLAEMIEERPEMTAWVWRTADGAMPEWP